MELLSAQSLVWELWPPKLDVIAVGEGDGVMEDVEEYLDNITTDNFNYSDDDI